MVGFDGYCVAFVFSASPPNHRSTPGRQISSPLSTLDAVHSGSDYRFVPVFELFATAEHAALTAINVRLCGRFAVAKPGLAAAPLFAGLNPTLLRSRFGSSSRFEASIFEPGICVENSEVFANTSGTGPYYVKPQSAGPTLKCSVRSRFADRTRYQVQWQRYNKGDLRYISVGDQLHDSAHYELVGDVTKGVYDLKLKDGGTDSVIGSYYCIVLDRQETQQYQADPIEVIALVPPSDPVITDAPSQAVTSGDSVTFKCTSTGGSPPPTMSWTFLNGSKADDRNVNTLVRGGSSESTLQFVSLDLSCHIAICLRLSPLLQLSSSCGRQRRVRGLRRDQQGHRIRAAEGGTIATNKAIEFEQPKEARSPRLNVLFKPRVRVSPDQDVAIEAGHHVELVCDADSNPYPPSYEWRHLALGEVYAASKWTVMASRNMSARSSPSMYSTLLSLSPSLILMSIHVCVDPGFRPETNSPGPSYNPREGERVQMECSVDANPQAVDVKWSGSQGFLSDGPVLVLKSVSREQTGNYTCSATNYLSIYGETGSQTRTGSATTVVDVQRPPGHADISPPRLNVVVGGTITLICSTRDPGSPAGGFKWASPSSGGLFGTREHDHAQLIVRNAQLADNGRYRCRADNVHGEGKEAVVDVTVRFVRFFRSSCPATAAVRCFSVESAVGGF
ncbi:unnamed protein product [Heligmosomoides polygyrus]|uniref:Ig-like domain-containing protein n=1 Tax=Heligmosomoides polygyrus TaxID=6339 RepID=A0A183GBS3_HELPZ|nr:unnamed protein product [Heligmosomoides polygyrus]